MNKTELTKIKEMVKEEHYGALNAYLKEIEYNLSLEELNSNTSKKRLNTIKKYLDKNLKMSKIIAANAKKHHKCPKIYGKVKNKSLL